MAKMHGVGGNVTFASGYTTGVKTWSVNTDIDNEEGLAFTELWYRVVTGGKRWGGSFTAYVDDTTTLHVNDMAGDTGAATFQFATNYSLFGDIVIIDSTVDVDVSGGPIEITFNFRGDDEYEVDIPGTASATSSSGA